MPRDGSDIYSQPFPDVVEGTEIESAVYNGFVSDIALDLNTPRPIIAGGTDAANAADALFNLGAEKAAQVVTNYDSHIWSPGSFYSASSATGGPVGGHAFAGNCYINEPLAQPPTNQNVVVEARDLDDAALPGLKYVREKKAGTWTSWYTDGLTTIGDAAGIASLTGDLFVGVEGTSPASAFVVNSESDNTGIDLLRVRKDGGTTVRLPSGGAGLALDKAASGQDADLLGRTNGANRWILRMGNTAAESGGNAGSDFQLIRYDDAGGGAVGVMHAVRSNGNVSFENNVAMGGALHVTGASTLTGAITVNGGVSGNLNVTGNIQGAMLIGSQPYGNPQLKLIDSTTSWSKNFRINPSGALEIINHGFTAGIFSLEDGGIVHALNEVKITAASANHLRLKNTYGVIHRVDGSDYWMLLTNNGDPDGTFNALRPFRIELANGNVAMSHAVTISGTLTAAAINASSTITGAGTIQAVRFVGNATYGVEIGGYTDPGGFYQSKLIEGNPNWGSVKMDALHFPGTWAGMRISVGGTDFFDFRNGGGAYKPGAVTWISTSDGRIKNIKGEYASGLDQIAALRPVRFTYKGNDTTEPPSNYPTTASEEERAKAPKDTPAAPYRNSPAYGLAVAQKEFVGLIAQEAEMVMPELVTKSKGHIDGAAVDDMRELDPSAIIFALINAVKELKARVEELESVA